MISSMSLSLFKLAACGDCASRASLRRPRQRLGCRHSMKTKKLDEQVSVGGQPSAEEIRELAQMGFRSIVNLRREGEQAQPLSPAEEGNEARQAGLGYAHIPISLDHLQT